MKKKTKEIIEKVYKLNDKIKEKMEKEGDAYKVVMTTCKDDELTIERNGKKVKVTVGELFEEVMAISQMPGSSQGQAYKLLKKKFPKLIGYAEDRDSISLELHELVQKELGFNSNAMSFVDYMRMTELLIEKSFEEKGIK